MKKKQLLLAGLFGLAAFLRLWNFPNTLQFLGDQGRDAIIAKRILIEHHPALIGPVTSVGNMYLGPLYYYFMVPFLWLTYPSPIGPAYGVALVAILTVVLMYYLGKEVIGEKPAIIGTALFTVSSVAIYLSRFSWNPNPAPFFALILVWAVYRALTKSEWYWILASACIAALIQLHYVAILTIPATGIWWLFQLIQLTRSAKKKNSHRHQLRTFFMATAGAVILFLLSLIPLVAFDYRHNWINAQAFHEFFTHTKYPPQPATLVEKSIGVVAFLYLRLSQVFVGVAFELPLLLQTVILFFVLLATYIYYRLKGWSKNNLGAGIILSYLIFSVIGLTFYQGNLYNHYLTFVFPCIFLLYGVLLNFFSKYKGGIIGCSIFVLIFLGFNFSHLNLSSYSWKLSDINQTSQTILNRVKPEDKYNLILFSSSGDLEGQNYRYFLDISDHPPLPKEKWGEANVLFIINENKSVQKLTGSPVYEISTFPNKNPAEVYTIQNGPEITVLRTR
jgi:hypothetical protein